MALFDCHLHIETATCIRDAFVIPGPASLSHKSQILNTTPEYARFCRALAKQIALFFMNVTQYGSIEIKE